VGLGLRGRGLVEPLRAAELAFVGRGGKAGAPPVQRAEQARSRPKGPLVLRALCARSGTNLAALRRWSPGERHNHAVPLLGPPEARRVGKKARLLVWDKWIATHNRRVKERGSAVRIVPCFLPEKSPWLDAIEPKRVHGKCKVVEPEAVLTAHELADRVCEVFGCAHEPHLPIPQEVA
jgi:hypothetical protein